MENKNRTDALATAFGMIKNKRLPETGSVPVIGEKKKSFPGYPAYPAGDDIYNKGKKLGLDPEDLSKNKRPRVKPGKNNKKNLNEVALGVDLDVPGAELDDEQENVGSEDEENNYYSLGGDRHDDLDEDRVGISE